MHSLGPVVPVWSSTTGYLVNAFVFSASPFVSYKPARSADNKTQNNGSSCYARLTLMEGMSSSCLISQSANIKNIISLNVKSLCRKKNA